MCLLFVRNWYRTTFLKELEILNQERREQVRIIVIENVNSILVHKSRPANKQHIKQPINLDLPANRHQ